MLTITSSTIAERKIVKTLGLVRGSTIRARNVGVDILALLKTLIGGEIGTYTKMLNDAREEALNRMKEEAEKQGADAVIGTRFSTSTIMGGAAEIMAYGTAVKLEYK